jgi:hypothetical protein
MRFLAELFSEPAIFGSNVHDHALLPMVDPTGEQQLPRLQKGIHISPNAL